MEIGAHPGLSETQKRVFAMDCGRADGLARIPARRALLSCALKQLGLHTDPEARRPQDHQVVLLNRDVVMGGLA